MLRVVSVHYHAKFHVDHWNCCRNVAVFRFSILFMFYACLDHPRSVVGGLYRCAKFGCNQHRSVVFSSRPRSEGWPYPGLTFSMYLWLLSFWLTLPRIVLSTYWCCPSRPCVVFLTCVHLALFLALSLSPGNSLVSSWCDHSMLASLLWQCLTVPSLVQLC